MSTPTSEEKEHWRKCIAARIDRKLQAVRAAHPGYLERVAAQARQRVWVSLGLTEIQAELEAIAQEQEHLKGRQRRACQALLAVLRRVPPEQVEPANLGPGLPAEARRALARRQRLHEQELLAEDPTGREILQLRREKECLVATVWLATAPRALKHLWKKVGEVLGDDLTPLLHEALAIEPDGP